MSQSLTQVYLHIIFGTKDRLPMIHPVFENELYQYIEIQCNEHGCIALRVGGCIDHVHILCRLSKHFLIPKLLELVKGSSSKWVKTNYPEFNQFYWQDGYAAFSVSPHEIDKIDAYIQNQHIHHASKTFQEEYVDLLDRHRVKYDPKYLWH